MVDGWLDYVTVGRPECRPVVSVGADGAEGKLEKMLRFPDNCALVVTDADGAPNVGPRAGRLVGAACGFAAAATGIVKHDTNIVCVRTGGYPGAGRDVQLDVARRCIDAGVRVLVRDTSRHEYGFVPAGAIGVSSWATPPAYARLSPFYATAFPVLDSSYGEVSEVISKTRHEEGILDRKHAMSELRAFVSQKSLTDEQILGVLSYSTIKAADVPLPLPPRSLPRWRECALAVTAAGMTGRPLVDAIDDPVAARLRGVAEIWRACAMASNKLNLVYRMRSMPQTDAATALSSVRSVGDAIGVRKFIGPLSQGVPVGDIVALI